MGNNHEEITYCNIPIFVKQLIVFAIRLVPDSNYSWRNKWNVFFQREYRFFSNYEHICKTTDGCVSWTSSYIDSGAVEIVYFTSQNTGYITAGIPASDTTNFGEIFKTTNGGLNWVLKYHDDGYAEVQDIKFFSDTLGVVALGRSVPTGFHSYIYRTINGGNSWTQTYNLPQNLITSLSFVDQNTGYASSRAVAGGNSPILKTTDGGQNWVISSVGPTIFKFVFVSQTRVWANNGVSKLSLSTDAGISWILKIDIGYNWFNDMIKLDAQNGYAIGHNGIIYKTTDSGDNWYLQNSNTSDWLYHIFFINNSTGFISGLTHTILKTTDGGGPVGIRNIDLNVPNSFSLMQNYPNPFNPSTKVKFDISKSSFTEIKIYDILGGEVADLIHEQLKPGSYEVEWDASNFASGLYFYKLVAGDYVETKKMILLK